MIEILSDVFHTAVREDAWNKNSRLQPQDAEIEIMRLRNAAKQRWEKLSRLQDLP